MKISVVKSEVSPLSGLRGCSGFMALGKSYVNARLKPIGSINSVSEVTTIIVEKSADGNIKTTEQRFAYPNQIRKANPNCISILYAKQELWLIEQIDLNGDQLGDGCTVYGELSDDGEVIITVKE